MANESGAFHSRDSAAVQFMVLDILQTLLVTSETPAHRGKFLAQQVRELVGARIVAILRPLDESPGHRHALVALEPARYGTSATLEVLEALAHCFHEIEVPALWEGPDVPEAIRAILEPAGFNGAMVVPLRVGARTIGLLVVLHLLDMQRHAETLRVLEILAPVAALVVQNTLLFETQEAVIQARTQDLQSSERHFHTLAQVAPVGILHMGLEGEVLFVNARWKQLTGHAVPPLGHPAPMQVHADDQAEVVRRWAELRRFGTSFQAEFRVETPEGDTRWVFGEMVAERDEAGAITGFIGSLLDVTERKRLDAQLQETLAILQASMDQNPAGIAIADAATGSLRYVNDAGLLIRGGDRESIVNGVGIDQYVAKWQLLDLDGRPLQTEEVPLARAILFGETNSRDFIVRRSEGEDRVVSGNAAPIRDAEGRVVAGVVVFTDITERKQAEATLRESEATFRKLFEVSSDGILLIDGTGVFVECNQAALDLLKMTREGFLFLPPARISPEFQPDGRRSDEKAHELIALAYRNGSHRFEWTHLNAEGGEFILEVCLTPVSLKGQVMLLTTWRDITARKRTEREITQRIEVLTQPLGEEIVTFEDLFQLEEIQRIQDEFAAATGVASIITHPDGTPITAPSHFTPLCRDIIRKTEQGCANCLKSDALLGRFHPEGPVVQTCLSGGLWDAGANISVGGRHLANWLIGQVRDETQTDEDMRAYARAIGADEEATLSAFHALPTMSREHFGRVADALFTLAQQLSHAAYQNIQQARYIAQAKQAEATLRESEERWKFAIEGAGEGLWDWNVQTGKAYYSPRYKAMYGYVDSDFGTTSDEWSKRIHPEDAPGVFATLQPYMEGKPGSAAIEFRMLCKDGSWRWTLGRGMVISRDSEGRPTRMIGTNTDITERKQAEEDKARLQAQLQQSQKMESLGTLAGGVAHDMNNVLGAILGLASANVAVLPAGSPTQRAFQTILTAAERGGKMIKSLLSFARQHPAEDRVLDFNELVREEVHLLERTTLAKVSLVLDLDAGLRPIRGDASALTHALMNLCVNAVDAMEGQGTLTLRTRNAEPGWVEVSVVDTGAGMSPDILAKALDPFFTTKEVGKGTGLGLSMVYSTVKAHQGHMEIQSEVGQGTCVRLRFPTTAPEAETSIPPALQAPEGTTLSVLLVDDDELIQSSMLAILDLLGHQATAVSTGEEALAKLASGFQPHVVILDMNMPGLGGMGTLPRLRALHPTLPVFLATGRVDQAALNLAGAHAHVTLLSKPFTVEELQRQLAELKGVGGPGGLPS